MSALARNNDDTTWEEFFGTSTELMPSMMSAFDAIIENTRHLLTDDEQHHITKNSTPKRIHNASNNFAHLSPCVQKILSNLPDQDLNKRFNSEETLSFKRVSAKTTYRSLRSSDKHLNKSNESLDIISPNVQKMLANFPDTELVLTASTSSRNSLFLHTGASSGSNNSGYYQHSGSQEVSSSPDVNSCLISGGGAGGGKTYMYHSDCESGKNSLSVSGSKQCDESLSDFSAKNCENSYNNYSHKPLGSYLHTSPQGIASRTPVGRRNMGKYLQVPSESSVGTMSSSTASSGVSRPVSLTSLGSCSSSSSSGPNHTGSVYLASAESLDSDPEPNGSQGSADSGIAEPLTISAEMRVLQEVLDTETVYVADLHEVIQGYLQPWKADPDCPLAEYLPHLFSNLEEIYEFNNSFLDHLQQADCDPTKIANVFIQRDNGFSVYNEYCTNYPRTMDVLGELTRDEKIVPLFREKQIALGHALPLGSYLLKPVQRILKYRLLLQRLSKQCDDIHKATVDLALTTMTSIASNINNMKRKHEHAVRVQEIQSQLYGWPGPDLTALGELIAEGSFRVVGARGRRHVFLFDKVLLMAKNKQDGALAYKSHIMCSNLMLVEQVRGEPLSFHVLPFDNPRLQCTLRARSPHHKREWTLQIKRVILENYSAVIPNHARQLVMQLGQDVHHESDDTVDKWSPLKQHTTPHYLERRCRVRKSQDISPNNRRAVSQDRSFPSLGSWRRKSEPNMIPQYNTKTMPKKISKMKKAKAGGSAKFYTDLSDSENCDGIIGESNESLEINNSQNDDKIICDNNDISEDIQDTTAIMQRENNLEKIVSDLLMQNQEFHKIWNRQRRVRDSEPGPTIWYYENRLKLPSKADSLPRSFQLNDQINAKEPKEFQTHQLDDASSSLKENPDVEVEEQHDNDLTSHLDDNEYPINKIYRKTAIRFSLLQRIRAVMSEEQKRTRKYPLHKQGSKSMGEKIAHPDYVDPQKLFVNSSRSNLTLELPECDDMMAEPERLDMTISEHEVLNEFDRRLNDKNSTKPISDTGQYLINESSHNNNINRSTLETHEITTETNTIIKSSQNSDSYYESILEKNLVEEYVKDSTGKLVAKQDSFNKNCDNKFIYNPQKESYKSVEEKTRIKTRPTKAPPPIPAKPVHLINNNNGGSNSINSTKSDKINSNDVVENNYNNNKANCNEIFLENGNRTFNVHEKSWVKAMVGRFDE